MDDRNAQVGWTEAQWNRVREEVLQAWQRVRVAGSFLPIYGPLPPSTQVVPSEVLKPDGSVDDRATAVLLEIALPVTLSRQQIWEEDLSSALLQFRRRATQLGQLEDWFIFNGTYPSIELSANAQTQLEQEAKAAGLPYYRPDLPYLKALGPGEWAPMSGTPTPIASANQSQSLQIEGMLQRNPGALGLIEGPRVARGEKKALEAEQAQQEAEQDLQHAQQAQQHAQQALQRALQTQLALQQLQQAQQQAVQALQALQAQQQALQAQQQVQQAQQRAQQARQRAQQARQARDEVLPRDNDGLMDAIVKAINSLEERGYVGPYVCVFGRRPFEAAHESIRNSTALPRDRIEPLIGRELLHASAIDVPPYKFELYDSQLDTEDWRSRGVFISMADEPIDLALVAEATPEFRQVDLEGRYVFSVFERFTLRIKDVKAIVPLRFKKK